MTSVELPEIKPWGVVLAPHHCESRNQGSGFEARTDDDERDGGGSAEHPFDDLCNLRETVHRVLSFISADRILIVDGRRDPLRPNDVTRRDVPGHFLSQPRDCGSLASILLAVRRILDEDEDSTVLILPAGQFVYPPREHAVYLALALVLAANLPDGLVQLGATPYSLLNRVDWLETSRELVDHPFPVRNLRVFETLELKESPDVPTMRRLFGRNGYWNTGISAVRAKTIWRWASELVPDAVTQFEFLGQVLRAIREHRAEASHEGLAFSHVYGRLGAFDFGREVLRHVTERILTVPMDGIVWNTLDQLADSATARVALRDAAPSIGPRRAFFRS